MKINWKIIAEYALVIFAIVCAISAYHFYSLYKSEKETKTFIAAVKDNFSVPPIKKYKDTAGRNHYQAPGNTNVFTERTIKNNPTSTTGPDTTAKILAIQKDQIEYWKQIALTISAKNLKAQGSLKDSLGRIVRYYKDKYLSIAYHYPSSGDTTDKGSFDYSQDLVVTGAQYFKKKFLWIKSNPVIDIYPDDPHATINSLRSFSVAPNPSPFSFKAFIRGDYFFGFHSVNTTLGANFGVGNVDIGGGLNYNMALHSPSTVVSAAYNFINIR